MAVPVVEAVPMEAVPVPAGQVAKSAVMVATTVAMDTGGTVRGRG